MGTLVLGVRLHDPDALDRHASVDLLDGHLRHARGEQDTRVADEPAAADAIADLCAGLPLALHITAALLADSPGRPLAVHARALEAAHTRLDRLHRKVVAVRAAFDLSYQRLAVDHARLFCLLALAPGPRHQPLRRPPICTARPWTWSVPRTSCRTSPAPTWSSSLQPRGSGGRWRMHDLVRLYADEHGRACADTDQRDTALTRLLAYYRDTTAAAATHLDMALGPASPRFPDRGSALAWLDVERPTPVAAAAQASALGHPQTSTDLVFTLSRYFHQRRYAEDWIAVSATALEASREPATRLLRLS
ncbi:hypothetical protein ACWCQS_38710 [Streptomyces sp. NPDC002076]